MQRFFTIILFFTMSTIGMAQNKTLTIDEAVIGQWQELYPQTLRNIQWQGKSKNFTFQDYQNLYQQSISKGDSTILLTTEQLNTILINSGLDSTTYFPQITWENNNEFHFYYQKYWCAISLKDKELIAHIILPNNAENKNLVYNNKLIAYTIDNNLYISGTNSNSITVTNNNDKSIVNGQSVSRNEFGINGGIFWSPSADYIAFYKKDESKVKDYPLVDITARQAELNAIKYPMAGMASEHISLGIYNLNSKQTIFIESQDTISEKYLTNISWGPEDKFIYIQVLNRAQNHMKLNKYSIINGDLSKTLFEEKNNKYVEPQHAIIFLKNKKNQFIYQTRNNGYNHAYLYNTKGNLIKQITTGKWEITDIVHLNNNSLYYISTEESPLDRHLYKININSGEKNKLTSESGSHNIVFNSNSKYFVDNYTNTDTPRNIDIRKTNGDLIRKALHSANPLTDYNMPKMEIGTIKAADGETDLFYRLIKPSNFDSNKKYPVIIYVYGGPHAQLIENKWLGGARMWNYYMAQKGYVMLTVDNRGSANRGLEFENIIHRQCGVAEMNDQMKGIDLLKELGFVDMNKIGVHGWSYGGFMTTSLMVNYPNIFKVGASGGPVIDWKYYEIMYGERYMDTPEENPEGYIYTSLVPRAKDLKGKLLIIHGAIDNTVVMQHSQIFVRECIKTRTPVDYFIYPRAEHNVRGYDRIHLMEKVSNYFDDYLK